jgi:hypothetical protein
LPEQIFRKSIGRLLGRGAAGTRAGAVTLQDSSEQAEKVVLAGNIGKFSLLLRQCGKALSLQGSGMRMMILSCISRLAETEKCPLRHRS